MSVAQLSHEALLDRYQLLCRASQRDTRISQELLHALFELEALISTELVALSREECPDNIADILSAFEAELSRFREFCEFPALASKSVVGFGGGFSAGKSSLINSLIGRKCLAVEVDPTTSMPAYVIAGDTEKFEAMNIHHCLFDMTQEQLQSLTHEEKARFGSQVGILLKSAFISLPELPWQNLALLDTPGYSKADNDKQINRTDAHMARTQLNSANYIVWAVSAEAGVIPEADIEFLASLDAAIPKIVVITRADKKVAEDIESIVSLVAETLALRGIAVQGVYPFSSRKRAGYPVDAISASLSQWNHSPRELQFARNFKRLFVDYQQHLTQLRRQAQKQRGALDRVVALVDHPAVERDVELMRNNLKYQLDKLASCRQQLDKLSDSFFTKFKSCGDLVGIELPEPSAIELIQFNTSGLLSLLIAHREKLGLSEPEENWFSGHQLKPAPQWRVAQLTRKPESSKLNFELAVDTKPQAIARLLRLIRPSPLSFELAEVKHQQSADSMLRQQQSTPLNFDLA
ncbi:dynamin family protein [Shewanella algae]|uniref:dynamin family protein n=1 Tax=Shewanella algae TaxID=38313 RepID=UPI001BF0D3C8|nr:dynamin family protein [Shewanella algae]BCV28943.1 GTPase [Shewanella algae]